jgi:hypothetical protein
MVGELSKSAGSTTASRNRNGAYFRTRVVPVNPNTTKQAAARAALASTAGLYRALTEAQRLGWESLGAFMERLDSLGRSYTLTGEQAYISVNRNLLTIGSAVISTAPAYAVPTALTLLTVTATSV